MLQQIPKLDALHMCGIPRIWTEKRILGLASRNKGDNNVWENCNIAYESLAPENIKMNPVSESRTKRVPSYPTLPI